MRHWGWPMPIHEKTVLAFQLLYPESGNIRSKRFNDYITAKIWFRPEIKVHKWYIQISDFLMFGKILIYPWDFRAWFIFLSFHRHRCGQSMWFSIVVPGNGSKKTTSPHGIGNNPRKSIEYCLNGKTMLWLIHWDNSTSIIHWERPIVSDWWHFSVSLVHILVVELHHPFVCRILPGAAGQIWLIRWAARTLTPRPDAAQVVLHPKQGCKTLASRTGSAKSRIWKLRRWRKSRQALAMFSELLQAVWVRSLPVSAQPLQRLFTNGNKTMKGRITSKISSPIHIKDPLQKSWWM